ncbi:outer membrane beta-barrel protein [Salinarimonas sp.]|uniref:outer membrane protein n=1 Tax=Salinarimonas sp. TaxID=2766526 RepID=UPI0032D95B59
MKRFLAAALPAALVSAGAAPALAADAALPPLPAIAEPVSSAPVGAGWYLRGDIGYTAYRDPEATLRAGGVAAALSGERLDDAAVVGLGAGYRFNSWLRVDVTADHRFETQATLLSGAPAAGALARADLSSTAVLANAYLDLGTWHGFTPYVGAGAGYAWNTLSGYALSGCGAPCTVGGTPLAMIAPFPDETTGSFAWALMAGVSVDAGRSLSLDIGYRYVDLGEAATGASSGAHVETDRISAHEARIGLRWTFADEPAFAPAPLSRSF